jgi:hypothetical protein
LEIWQTLRAVVEAFPTDPVLAQTLLQSADIACPSNNLADACYDTLGNQYQLPPYVLFPPTNVIATPPTVDKKPPTVPAHVSGLMFTLIVRLTNNKDISLKASLNDTWNIVADRVCLYESLDRKAVRIRFFRLGKLLELDHKLSQSMDGVNEGDTVVAQAMVTPL